MIPQEQTAAVTRALHEAFGAAAIDDIRDLTERTGSNRAFRIMVRGSAYLLRINTRAGDVARQFECMRAAAEAGLAPRVRYANAEDRVSITDFIEAVPLAAGDALRLVPAALRRLHGLAPFPGAPFNTTCTFLLNEGPALDGFVERVRAANGMPRRETEELLAHCTRVAEVCSALEPDLAPSHNDLFKPDNILFDASRVWLVDWEAAFQNDRYADLAVTANMLVLSEAEEPVFLGQYFGSPPDSHQAARLYVMRQLAHAFYAMAFLTLSVGGEAAGWSDPVPEYEEFQRRFWSREVHLADAPSKAIYGRVHWERLKHNLRQPRFNEASQILTHGRGRASAGDQADHAEVDG